MPEVDANPMHLDELRLVLGEGLVALANRPVEQMKLGSIF